MKAIQSETSGLQDNNNDKLIEITTHTHAHGLQRMPILGQLWTAASVTLFPTGQMIRVSQNEYAHWNFVCNDSAVCTSTGLMEKLRFTINTMSIVKK